VISASPIVRLCDPLIHVRLFSTSFVDASRAEEAGVLLALSMWARHSP
jgi:hypothetical protein